MDMVNTVNRVTSRDGTSIAFERSGAGPALILVDAAGNYGGFRPLRAPVELLAADFTVYVYDRRGRGGSGDTPPYAIEREVDDLAALIAHAGGSAFLYGMSSGSLLALHAAASGLAIPKLALFEPPIQPNEAPAGETGFTAELAGLVAAGRRRDAVAFFHRGIGVPDEVMDQMMTPAVWAALEAVAHTLVYDCRLSDATSSPLIRSVTAPTLVIDSQASGPELAGMAAAVVEALPNGAHRTLPGEWHGVPDEALAPVLTGFFRG
jgi:pimeloyl-ACP methyl ester carboxylesterase